MLYLAYFADGSFEFSICIFIYIQCRQHRIVQDSARTVQDGLGQCRNVRDNAGHRRTLRDMQDSVEECRTV